jgi:hypothetical protein
LDREYVVFENVPPPEPEKEPAPADTGVLDVPFEMERAAQ